MPARVELEDLAEQVTIPTLPDVVMRLIAIVEDPHVEIDDIAKLVSQDAPITSRVLRIANSAVYGLQAPAVSALDAARVVGARTLKNIALQTSVVGKFEHLAGIEDFDINSLWKHAVFVGQMAQEAAVRSKAIRGIPPDELYTCGLLHDIGKVVLLESMGDGYLDVYRTARVRGCALHLVEREVLGFDHTDVGALVATRWRLHDQISHVIRYHHGPRTELKTPHVAAVAVADQLGYRLETGGFEQAAAKLAALAEHLLQLDQREFDDFVEWAREILPLVEV